MADTITNALLDNIITLNGSLVIISNEMLKNELLGIQNDNAEITSLLISNGNGSLIQLANGDWSYEPDPDWGGPFEFVASVTENGETLEYELSYDVGEMISGTSGSDHLTGGAGNDLIDGGQGSDILAGGLGDDVYQVDRWGDKIKENGGEGIDTVISTSKSFKLSDNVENLILSGQAIKGVGNAEDNIIIGNAEDNIIKAHGGADTVDGGAGDDVINLGFDGNTETDTLQYSSLADGHDVVTWFGENDEINFSSLLGKLAFEPSISIEYDGKNSDVWITPQGGEAINILTLKAIDTTDFTLWSDGRMRAGTDPEGGYVFMPLNEAPTVDNTLSFDVLEDTSFTLSAADILANTSDADGDALNVGNVMITSGQGNLTDNGNGTWTFTPATDWNGDAKFSFDVTDGIYTVSGNVGLSVTPVNDVPTASGYFATSLLEDGSIILTSSDLLAGANDVDGDALFISNVTLASGDGNLFDNGDGTWTFTPDANWNGTSSFTYDVSDGSASISRMGDIDVIAVNDAPIITSNLSGTILEDTSLTITTAELLANASDADNDVLSITNVTLASGQADLVDNGNGTWTFTPTADWNGDASISYDISDGTVTIGSTQNITVSNVNDKPVIASFVQASIAEDTSFILTTADILYYTSDADNDALTISNITLSSGLGSLTDNGNGTWTFTPDTNWNGSASFSFDVSDGIETVSASVPLSVISVNDAPTASGSFATNLLEDGSVTLTSSNLLADATDVDGDALSVSNLILATGNGNLSDNGDGTWTFTPDANWNGIATFNYDISDGSATISRSGEIDVIAVNDAPVTYDANFSAEMDSTVLLSTNQILTADYDIEGDNLTIANVQDPVNGTVTLDAGGNVSFIPTSGYVGSASFGVSVIDNDGGLSVKTVFLDITSPVVSVNEITGTSSNDVLTGTSGDDRIDGLAGSDVMTGGAGDDTYVADRWGDKVAELASEGIDTVISSANAYKLQDNVENLVLNGNASKGTGTNEDNVITGNEGDDLLEGLLGADNLDGGAGNDTLNAGWDEDVDVISYNSLSDGIDTIKNFRGNDQINVSELISEVGADASFTMVQNGSAAEIWVQQPGLSDQQIISIENYDAASLNITNGVISTSSATSPPPSSTTAPPPSSSSTTTNYITREDVLQTTASEDVVGFNVSSGAAGVAVGDIITFGQAFKAGDIPTGDGLVAVINGVEYPAQLDVKTTNPDGSVAHGIVSVEMPGMNANTTQQIMLKRVDAPADDNVDLTQFAQDLVDSGNYDFQVDFTLHTTDGANSSVSIDGAGIIQAAIASGSIEPWMNGGLATEFRVSYAVNQDLQMDLDIRVMADGDIRTDMTINNDWAYSGMDETYNYDVAVTQDGQSVYAQNDISHYQHSNWHQQFFKDGETDMHMTRDIDYLVQSGAIAGIDTSIQVSEDRIAQDYADLQQADTGPLGFALNENIMPTTGQNAGDNVGIMTNWQTNYLLSQDARAEEVMLANADAAGGVPWHYTDEATGLTVTIDDHPNMRIRPGSNGINEDAFDDAMSSQSDLKAETGWKVDTAHQPSFSFLPYLITGDRYYLDNLEAQAEFSVAYQNPQSRGGSDGLLLNDQVRGQAWALRSLIDAASIIPEDTAESLALKTHFSNLVENNLNYYNTFYVDGNNPFDFGEMEGYVYLKTNLDGEQRTWMDDYFTMAVAYAAQKGFDSAETLLDWKIQFTAGRFLAEELGMDPAAAGQYSHVYFDGATGTPYTTWQEMYDLTYGPNGRYPEPTGLYHPENPAGYPAIAKAALALAITQSGSADAIDAFGYLTGETYTAGIAANYSINSKQAMAITLKDGSTIQNDDIVIGTSSGEALSGSDQSDLLHGMAGDDHILGNAGIDLLYGGDGDDHIEGGAGDDFIFGNKGNDLLEGGDGNDHLRGHQGADVIKGGAGDDQIIGGSGNDILEGGAGNDTFIFDHTNNAGDIITDFTVGEDILDLREVMLVAGQTAAVNMVQAGTGTEVWLNGTDSGDIRLVTLENTDTNDVQVGNDIWI